MTAMNWRPFGRSVLLLTCLALVGTAALAVSYTVTVTPDQPETIYALNQEVRFTIHVLRDGINLTDGAITYSIDGGLNLPQTAHTCALMKDPVTVVTAKGEPGEIRCTVTFSPADANPVSAVSVVGVALDQMQPTLSEPDDFSKYWKAERAKLAKLPMTVTRTPVPTVAPDVTCEDVEVTCVPGKPVKGYLAKPKTATKHSVPAMLFLPYAGVAGANKFLAEKGAQWGALSLSINVFGVQNGQPDAYYTGLWQGPLAQYFYQGRESRDTFFFHDVYLMVLRSLDFLTDQPEWNGKILAVYGSSQGGGLAIVAAGLDARVTYFGAAVPAMCDHAGMLAERPIPWPQLIPCGPDGKPNPEILKTAGYYDPINFARRCKATALFTVGFLDIASPPTGVYAAYNQLKGHKEILNGWLLGHEVATDFDDHFKAMVFPAPAK